MLIMLLTSRLWFASIKFEKTAGSIVRFRYWNPDQYRAFLSPHCIRTGRSQYKLLFLLIIITSSLQYGFKHGMTVSAIASVIVLAIDLFAMPEAIVNEAFQDDLIIVGVFLLTAWLLGFYEKIEREHRESITQMAIIDGLTGVYNHRYFFETLKRLIGNAKKTGAHLSLLFIDIDHFKHYNDLFGHQEGDEVLKEIAEAQIQPQDLVCRYRRGVCGDSAGTNEQNALIVAERIRDD